MNLILILIQILILILILTLILIPILISYSSSLTYALALIGNPDGPSQNARGSSEMAGAGVHDAVIPAQVLLGRGHFRTHALTDDAVGVVVLIHYAGRASRAVHLVTRLCEEVKDDDNDINNITVWGFNILIIS